MEKRFKKQFNPKFNYLDQLCWHGSNGGGGSSDRYCYKNKSYMRLNNNRNIMDYSICSRGVGKIQNLRNTTRGNSTGTSTGNGRIQTKSDLKRQNNELNRMIVLHLNLIQEQNDELGERDREIEKRDNEITRLCIKNTELEEELQSLQEQVQKYQKRSASPDLKSLPKKIREATTHVESFQEQPQSVSEPTPLLQQVVVTSSNSVVNTKPNGEYNGKKLRTIFMQRINKESGNNKCGYLDRSTSPITNAPSSHVENEALNLRRLSQHLGQKQKDIGCEELKNQGDCIDPMKTNSQQVQKSYVTIDNNNLEFDQGKCLEIHENGDACDNDEKDNSTEKLELILPQENKDASTHLCKESQLSYASAAPSTSNKFQNLHLEQKELSQNDELDDSKIISKKKENDQNNKEYEKEGNELLEVSKNNIELQDNRMNNIANNQLIEEFCSNKDNDKYHLARKKDIIAKQLTKQETTELPNKYQDNPRTKKKMMLKLKNLVRMKKEESDKMRDEIKPSILSEFTHATVVSAMLKSEDSIAANLNSIELKQSNVGMCIQEKRNDNNDGVPFNDSLPVAPKNTLCYSTEWMYPTRAWEDGEIHWDFEFYLEEANELISENPHLEIPEWTVVTIPPLKCEDKVTENISDESFKDRHKKRVVTEIRRKKRDAKFYEEQLRRYKLQEKEATITQEILPLTTFYNMPEEVEDICFVSDVPVQAFGECLINLDSENSEFILPWLDVGSPPMTTTPIVTFGCKAVQTTAAQAQLQQLSSSYVFIKRPKRRNQAIQNRQRIINKSDLNQIVSTHTSSVPGRGHSKIL